MDSNFKELKALYINCTLKKSPELSHTEGLMKVSMDIMEKEGVSVEMIRFVDFDVPPGVYPDMTEKGWDKDDWVTLSKQVLEADILVIGTPIWLGEKSSVAQKLIERLYSLSGEMNDMGQYIYYYCF